MIKKTLPRKLYHFKAHSSDKPTYRVERMSNGSFACECLGFFHRKTCKHVTQAINTWK